MCFRQSKWPCPEEPLAVWSLLGLVETFSLVSDALQKLRRWHCPCDARGDGRELALGDVAARAPLESRLLAAGIRDGQRITFKFAANLRNWFQHYPKH